MQASQHEQDPIGFVSAVLKSCTQEPTLPDLERIAELTKSSGVDQNALYSEIYSLIHATQREHLRNALRIIVFCADNGSAEFKKRARGNILNLMSLLSRKADTPQSEEMWTFIREHIVEFVRITRPEHEENLRGLIRILETSKSKSYLDSIARANDLMQLSTSDGAEAGMLHRLKQSYAISHIVTLLAFEPHLTDARAEADAGELPQLPRTRALCALNDCVLHINGHRPVRDKLLKACADDAQSVLDGLQELLDAHSDSRVSIPRESVLRLLQDLSTASEMLPADYWITNVEEGSCITRGGEADISKGLLQLDSGSSEVVIRKIFLEDLETPTEDILKIIRREAITHRQLKHPNVLEFLGVFQSTTHPMAIIAPWVPGGNALNYMKEHRDSDCFMRTVIGIGSGLSYLHALKPPVFHGDLCGRNTLITPEGGVLLCDFGFSRIKHDVTRTRTSIREGGALRHMAPELSNGASRFRTTWMSDIFSFAMTIYELGTQSQPFYEIPNEYRVLTTMREGGRPSRPNTLGDLESSFANQVWSWVVKMWDQEPAERPTARDVHKGLEQIDAERKNPPVADVPSGQDLPMQGSSVSANETPTISSITNLLNFTRVGDLTSTRDELPPPRSPNSTMPSPNTPRTDPQIPRVVTCQTLGIPVSKMKGKSASVACSPRRNEFQFATGLERIDIWSVTHGSQGQTWSPRLWWNISQLACLSYSFDGDVLAGGSFRDIVLWDVNTGKKMGRLGHGLFITTLAFSPIDYLVASGSRDSVLLWDPRSKGKIPFTGHTGTITSVAFSSGGEAIASASSDKSVRLWDTRNVKCLRQLGGFRHTVTDVSLSPDGQHIAAACDDSTIRLWNEKRLDGVGDALVGHQASVKCLAFSPDSLQIASGSVDNTIRMWNVSTGTEVGLPLQGHTGTVESLGFSPKGNQIVSGSRDKTVKVWSLRDTN